MAHRRRFFFFFLDVSAGSLGTRLGLKAISRFVCMMLEGKGRDGESAAAW